MGLPDGRQSGDYRIARQASALLLIALVVVIVLSDSLGIGRQVEPLILVALLVAAAGLLAVDLPDLKR